MHPSYQATGGYLREEAILILRRFYVTENTNGTEGSFSAHILRHSPYFMEAPVPKLKANRVLKTEILPGPLIS